MSWKWFHFPGKNLVTVIPLTLLLGFVTGIFFDTAFLAGWILSATLLMIYPTMIGFNWKEAVNASHMKLIGVATLINFVLIPLVAWGLGIAFLSRDPQLMAGLVMASLLPTSGMTISWTMLSKGNVPGAVKLTALSLLLGSLLAPFYLFVMMGKYIPIDLGKTFVTIATVVVIPMVLGHFTFQRLKKNYGMEKFQKEIKPFFPSASSWAMLFVIFSSISMKAKVLMASPGLLVQGLAVLALFYFVNFLVSTITAKALFNRGDSFALVYGTALRNLSLALGLAVTAFGPQSAVIVTLAFIIQVQAAAWFGKMAQKNHLFGELPGELKESAEA